IYTREDIETIGWEVDTDPNGFYHTIGSFEQNQEDLKKEQERSTQAKKEKLDGENEYARRYVRSARFLDTDICVEIVTKFNRVADTCDGNTNNAYISLTSIASVLYGPSDYELRVSEEVDHRRAQATRVIQLVALANSFPGVHTEHLKSNQTVRPNGDNSLIAAHTRDSDGFMISNQLIPYAHSLDHTRYIWVWNDDDPSGSVGRSDFFPHPGHRLVVNAWRHRGDGSYIASHVKNWWWTIAGEYLGGEPRNAPFDFKAHRFVTDDRATRFSLSNEWLTDEWNKIKSTEGVYQYIDYYGTEQS
ncbi:hypothetical protein, partial [Vibrio harveyi]|uniref:hypothetical protein n=1 Tax=Vibrio harveyi TaxID=669 RepID=UPI000AFC98B2